MFSYFLKRFFDFVELGFIMEWTASSEQQKMEELQESNRVMTNEKNKYLTVFESIYDPIILVDKDNQIENLNHQALEVFFTGAVSGAKYYGNINTDIEFDWLKDDLSYFIALNTSEIVREQTVQTISGQKTFSIKFKKMLDISEKYRGTVIIFNDITERRRIEEELKKQYNKIEAFAFTDPMTGIANRITGLSALEKELSLLRQKDSPLSICFLDVDGLKVVNDTYGHLEGDSLIHFLVSVIKSSVRKIDTVSRLGGDEFLIIFPDCNEACAKQVLSGITEQLTAHDAAKKTPYPHSFSYGLLEVTKGCEWSANDVIKTVDAKMYEHKFLKKRKLELVP